MSRFKLCKTCRHVRHLSRNPMSWECHRLPRKTRSPLDGSMVAALPVYCWNERLPAGDCGPTGDYYVVAK